MVFVSCASLFLCLLLTCPFLIAVALSPVPAQSRRSNGVGVQAHDTGSSGYESSVISNPDCLKYRHSLHAISNGSETRPIKGADTLHHHQRRSFLVRATSVVASTLAVFTDGPLLPPHASAAPPPNPLNLKGTFWETGELYTKSKFDALSMEPPELIYSLNEAVSAFRSSLTDAASEGRYADLSRLIRGGAVSESRIRVSANVIMDAIEDERRAYLAGERFRVFSVSFDALDKVVEVEARPGLGAGGRGNDSRLRVLAILGEVDQSLCAFIKIAEDGLAASKK